MIVMNDLIIHLPQLINKMTTALTLISSIIPVIIITGMRWYCHNYMRFNRIHIRS